MFRQRCIAFSVAGDGSGVCRGKRQKEERTGENVDVDVIINNCRREMKTRFRVIKSH
jgi:hypothetical protein